MKYTEEIVDGEALYYTIRNDAGMSIGTSFDNLEPFEGCPPVTLQDAEKNAKLWAASRDLLEALIAANEHLDLIGWGDSYERECNSKLEEEIISAITKATE